jgi:small conductance mechanosensitive channel
MEAFNNQLVTYITMYGLQVIGAILILIVGRIAAGIGRKIAQRILMKARQEPSIVSFVGNLTYVLILSFAVVATLAKFGIQTASFIAILGAAGFAIGFALQGSLANFAAGVLLLVLRPFKVGDFIDAAGVVGTVQEIQLFNTILASPDNIQIIAPNSKIFGDIIKNISGFDTRRIDLVVGIGYGSSIQKAVEVLSNLMKEDARILSEPSPQIAVSELGDSSVNFVVRPWVKNQDYWTVRFDLTRKIKEAFDDSDIEIPFPQRVVHMVSSNS